MCDREAVARCIQRVLTALLQANLHMGTKVAIDATAIRAYGRGRRTDRHGNEKPPTDPDASWGRRSAVSTRKGGMFFGYKLHLVACAITGLPLTWTVQTAKASEADFAVDLLKATRDRGFAVGLMIGDKAFDSDRIHRDCMALGIVPVIPIRATEAVTGGGTEPPYCVHGRWTFAGADYDRQATKWRCPAQHRSAVKCVPASTWIKADRFHPLIPRDSQRFEDLYWERTAVEREFANLKQNWSLVPLRVRGLDRVRLHADLTILARLACALARTRRSP